MKKKKTRSTIVRNMNKPLFIMSVLYSIIGVLMILSASSISSVLSYGLDSSFYFFRSQIINLVVALFGAIVIIRFPTSSYRKLSFIAMAVCIGVIILTFLNGKIFQEGINTVTLTIFGKSFQPAEFLKVIMIVFLGSYYGKWSKKEHSKASFLYPIIVCAIPVLFIFLGGDFGSAAIMVALVALVFACVPTKEVGFKALKLTSIILLVLSVVVLKYAYLVIPEDILSSDYRLNRLIYKEPCSRYYSDSGYQVCNGYIAMNNGGLFGAGIGKSTQKYLYLPASHTDFIFAIVVEELGAIAGIIIVIGYMYIIYIILRVAKSCYNLQNSIICYGVASYFILHIFVNLGGVLGLLPLTGVPLPFLSYGGSYIISLIASFAVVQRIHIETREEKKNREIKRIANS